MPMLNASGHRPIDVPLWLSVLGPRGHAPAVDMADGIIGPPRPTLPRAVITSRTELDPDEYAGSERVREAIGPCLRRTV